MGDQTESSMDRNKRRNSPRNYWEAFYLSLIANQRNIVILLRVSRY